MRLKPRVLNQICYEKSYKITMVTKYNIYKKCIGKLFLALLILVNSCHSTTWWHVRVRSWDSHSVIKTESPCQWSFTTHTFASQRTFYMIFAFIELLKKCLILWNFLEIIFVNRTRACAHCICIHPDDIYVTVNKIRKWN